MLTYKQKHEQANREALATVIGLAVTIVVWIACGFGLAGMDVQVLHTPLWVVGGTIGTWICAIVVSIVLAKRVFVDFSLDDEQEASQRAFDAGEARTCPTQTDFHSRGSQVPAIQAESASKARCQKDALGA